MSVSLQSCFPILLGFLSLLTVPSTALTESFTSYIPFTLSPGEIIKHDLDLDDFPGRTSEVVITSFQADVVYGIANDTRVSLSEVYIHHWTVQATNRVNTGKCDDHVLGGWDAIDFMFGIGSETLGESFEFPNQTGIVVGPSDGNWTLQLHAIRLDGVPDPLACRECTCAATGVTDEDDVDYIGGLDCCNDDGGCVGADQTYGPGNYAVRYTIEYETNTVMMTPLYIILSTAPGFGTRCSVEYDIPRGNGVDVRRRIVTISANYDVEIVFMLMHMHSGAIKGTLRRLSSNTDSNVTDSALIASALEGGNVICTSVPVYDNDGYIVGMSDCDVPFKISKGERLVFESYYDNTGGLNETLYPHTAHTGVMAYLYFAGFPIN